MQLNVNAASIFSNLGDGQHGLLRLTVSDAQYNYVSTVPFVQTMNPGPTMSSVLYATAAQIKQAVDQHELQIKLFREYTLIDKVLKQLMLSAVEDKYYRVMRNSLIGYANVTTRSLIQYLYQAYVNITPTQVSNNDKKLRAPYDPNQPIEALYE